MVLEFSVSSLARRTILNKLIEAVFKKVEIQIFNQNE